MNKPIKDWTLGEVQEECRKHTSCDCSCKLYSKKPCEMSYDYLPADWDLPGTPTLTPDELAVLRLLKAAGFTRVKRRRYFAEFEREDDAVAAVLSGALLCILPSMLEGGEVDLTAMDLS